MLIIPALGGLRQENCKFKASLGYIGGHYLRKISCISMHYNE
jgi:hypothetical protein